MKMMRGLVIGLVACGVLAGCVRMEPREAVSEPRGTLLAIGGGLEDDNGPVYERFATLAREGARKGEARIVIVTTASGDEADAERGKRESFAVWCPELPVDVIGRETASAEAVAKIDAASALFFTGGDQKRITAKYRPGGSDSVEWMAMQRLLQRGGVIAGTSAGAAMMGDVMFFSGRSAAALGIVKEGERGVAFDPDNPVEDEDAVVIGPRIGEGMKLVPWALVDSHFFERDRIGRLTAALEASSARLGIGVGEDACVEINLATGEVTGTSVAASLLVDRAWVTRDGLSRRGGVARVLAKDDRVMLARRLTTKFAEPIARPAGEPVMVEVAEPGQSRQLASWRVFVRGREGLHAVELGGWRVVTWPDRDGWVGFDIEVPPRAR
ncbi:MAG TPA: cyanophycinase [Phycisphaerales bacterium]|nr:cyanophycinase [Phycisphaerales bacterium]